MGRVLEDAIRARVTQLRGEIATETNDDERAKLQERLAQLGGGIAVVKVGGRTDDEVSERRQAAIAALHSVVGAVEEGFVPSIAASYIHAQSALTLSGLQPGEAAGFEIIERCLAAPQAILSNASTVIEDQIRSGGPEFGFDATTGDVRDLIAAGVLDAAKTAREALQVAFWRARTIIETDTWDIDQVSPKREE